MKITEFEAAAIYAYRNSSLNENAQYLVLDLDTSSFGICTCDAEEKTTLQYSYADPGGWNLWDACIDRIAQRLETPNLPESPDPALQSAPESPDPALQSAPESPDPALQSAPEPSEPASQSAPESPDPAPQSDPEPSEPALQVHPEYRQQMEDSLRASADAIWSYLKSDKLLDSTLLTIQGNAISCSELEACIEEPRRELRTLLAEAGQHIPADQTMGLHIILLGRAQEIGLIAYDIRDSLSASPFLPDRRFVNSTFPDPWEKVVELGMEYHREKEEACHTCNLRLMDGQTGEWEEICLLKKGQSRETLEAPQYIGPVFLAADETISVEIDKKVVDIAVPYSFAPEDSDLIDIAMKIENGIPGLLIRRCRFPEQAFFVGLA